MTSSLHHQPTSLYLCVSVLAVDALFEPGHLCRSRIRVLSTHQIHTPYSVPVRQKTNETANSTKVIGFYFLDNYKYELECTHRVRTHAVLLLSVSSPSECEWSAIVVWNEVSLCSVIDRHLTLWPWPLTFHSQNHVTSSTAHWHSIHHV